MAFLSDKLAPFENLAKMYLRQNKYKEAFLMIERSRARVLAETLGGDFAAEVSGECFGKINEPTRKSA